MSIVLLFFLLCCIATLPTSPTVQTKTAKFPLHLFFIVFFCSCVSISCLLHQHKRKRKRKKKKKKEHIRGTALVKRGPSPSLAPDQKPACDTHAKHAERHTVLSPPPETADVRNKKRRRGRGGGGGGVLHQQQQTSRAH